MNPASFIWRRREAASEGISKKKNSMEYQQRNECTDAHPENQDGEAVTRLECFPGLLRADHGSSVTGCGDPRYSPAEPGSGSRVELRSGYSGNVAEGLNADVLQGLGSHNSEAGRVRLDADFGNLREAVRCVR